MHYFLLDSCIYCWSSCCYSQSKLLFAIGTAAFINGPAILLNSAPKIPPEWIILDIRVLNNFIFVNRLFSNAFFNFIFCYADNNNSWGKSFPYLKFSYSFSRLPLSDIWQQISAYLVVNLIIQNLFYCIQSFIYLQNFFGSFVKFKDCFLWLFKNSSWISIWSFFTKIAAVDL